MLALNEDPGGTVWDAGGVVNCLNRLQARGLITRLKRGNQFVPSVYRVNLEESPKNARETVLLPLFDRGGEGMDMPGDGPVTGSDLSGPPENAGGFSESAHEIDGNVGEITDGVDAVGFTSAAISGQSAHEIREGARDTLNKSVDCA